MAIHPPGEGEKPAQIPKGPTKSTARKPGHVHDSPGDQHEEHVADPERKIENLAAFHDQKERGVEDKKKTKEVKKIREDLDDEKRQGQKRDEEDQKPSTTPGHLSHDANYHRSKHAKKMGLDQSPGVEEIIIGQQSERAGESLGALLPSARARGHKDLPEVDVRPPEFLTGLEAMNDIYMRTRGRLSRKTKELLVGPDLEDLIGMLRAIFESDKLHKNNEARVKAAIYTKLKDDPGPLLIGLNDPRLTEPWRLFLDGWEIWVPKGDGTGVELFWEGEAEDDDGSALEMTQVLGFQDGALTLHTTLGEVVDKLTFDGQAFYRFKHDL